MKSPTFDFARPTTVEEAIELCRASGPDAKFMSGGQSLMPALALRMASPSIVIDLTNIAVLRRCEETADAVVVGALTTYREAQVSGMLRQWVPLLQDALPFIAHPAIRNAGTLGGSVALADPAAEMPAVCVALDASIEIAGSSGRRWVQATDFFQGLYQTALAEGELVTAISFPKAKNDEFGFFLEIARRRGDYASAGLAVWARREGARLTDVRPCLFGVSSKAVLLSRHAAAMRAVVDANASYEAAVSAFSNIEDEVEFFGDMHNSVNMKVHLARVLLARATQQMCKEIA